MNKISDQTRPKFRFSKIFWIGLGLLIVGSGPLLVIILLSKLGIGDPNPNPIGPGIMALFSFWPGIGLMIAGVIVSIVRHRRISQ